MNCGPVTEVVLINVVFAFVPNMVIQLLFVRAVDVKGITNSKYDTNATN